jgi:hypothetical protein
MAVIFMSNSQAVEQNVALSGGDAAAISVATQKFQEKIISIPGENEFLEFSRKIKNYSVLVYETECCYQVKFKPNPFRGVKPFGGVTTYTISKDGYAITGILKEK